MNKTQLVDALIVRHPHLRPDDVLAYLDSLTDIIGDELAADRSVTITGFGTFGTVWYSEHTVKHPKTGVDVDVPSGRRATFRAGDTLRRQVQADVRLWPIHR